MSKAWSVWYFHPHEQRWFSRFESNDEAEARAYFNFHKLEMEKQFHDKEPFREILQLRGPTRTSDGTIMSWKVEEYPVYLDGDAKWMESLLTGILSLMSFIVLILVIAAFWMGVSFGKH